MRCNVCCGIVHCIASNQPSTFYSIVPPYLTWRVKLFSIRTQGSHCLDFACITVWAATTIVAEFAGITRSHDIVGHSCLCLHQVIERTHADGIGHRVKVFARDLAGLDHVSRSHSHPFLKSTNPQSCFGDRIRQELAGRIIFLVVPDLDKADFNVFRLSEC